MQTRTIPAHTLQGIAALLAPYVPGLRPEDVEEAVRDHMVQKQATPSAAPGKLLRVRDACERLSCSRHTLWRMAKAGQIATVKIGKRSTRVPEAALLAFVAGRGGERVAS